MAITKLNSLAIPDDTIVEADLSYPLTNFSSTGIDDNATSTAITIDASENVGIGTSSPASFNSSGNDLVVGNGVASNDTGITVYTNSNATGHLLFADGTSGSDSYTGYIRYSHASDFMAFHTNAGAERMRIDSSGRVGIGVTNMGSDGVSILATMNFNVSEGANSSLLNLFRQSSSAATVLANGYKYTNTANKMASSYSSLFAKSAVSLNYGNVIFYTDGATTTASGTDVTPTERMRIDSSGHVGIGAAPVATGYSGVSTTLYVESTSAATVTLDSTGGSGRAFSLISPAAGALDFYDEDASAIRMRIDSSGRLMLGKTAYSVVGQGHILSPSGETFHTITTGLNTLHVYNGTDSSYKFYVLGNGGVANFSSNNMNLSDQRAKKDIVDSDNYLEKLCNIPVKNFRYNEDAEDGKHHLGVIAQDVEAVVPEFVNKSSWEHKDGPMDTVYNTDLMFAMMKSIQELSAQVTELKAEVAALKGA